MPTDGVTHRTDHLPTPDGVRLATCTWLPGTDSPRAIVQIAHGAAEHAQRYDRFARHLCAHGYASTASDRRLHGATAASTARPPRPRPPTAASTGGYGVVGEEGDSRRATVKDLRTVGDRTRRTIPGIPLFLLGHSMGSMLARDYAQEYGEDLAGLILSGTFRSLPATEPDQTIARLEAEIAEGGRTALSGFTTQLFAPFNDPYESGTGYEWLSRDPAEVAAYAADGRCGFPFSAGLSRDWVRAVRKINNPHHQARIPTRLPVHIAVGAEDPRNQRMTLAYELLEDFRYPGPHSSTVTTHQQTVTRTPIPAPPGLHPPRWQRPPPEVRYCSLARPARAKARAGQAPGRGAVW
ncbi:alpha/beta fold hydrolase [Streptomyces cuspidosporus]|uniref:Serine aminopeptidase S33 domain-containing protein n=1 Tax=Streptomyces cuspidosporus TaxID=66882 RepID=A0ABN3GB99_9ACTN